MRGEFQKYYRHWKHPQTSSYSVYGRVFYFSGARLLSLASSGTRNKSVRTHLGHTYRNRLLCHIYFLQPLDIFFSHLPPCPHRPVDTACPLPPTTVPAFVSCDCRVGPYSFILQHHYVVFRVAWPQNQAKKKNQSFLFYSPWIRVENIMPAWPGPYIFIRGNCDQHCWPLCRSKHRAQRKSNRGALKSVCHNIIPTHSLVIYIWLELRLRTYLFNINIHEWVQKQSVFDIVFMCNVALRPRTSQTNGLKFNIECGLSTATDDIVHTVQLSKK